ncbi:putative addiction module antidote protein, CC2985 family [Haloarcula vallismortis]|uniref:Putative addiction module antidote protein, CC2985 family n=1 Tax=Haloarcula vallismortis TaxID=28442 RepID=A0A1H3B7Y1_HALVA|nr:ribbon-helix-helix domain-containing protein [Haloarcula vallismortis]SDX38046.1 putative addiction module antidote protein, CC2985 family [Haloarcula vallismortis]
MTIASVEIPDKLLDKIDEEIENGLYNSRSELIREGIRSLLRQEKERKEG